MTHGPADIHELLAANDLHPSRALGQNFVADGNTVRRIVRLAGITEGRRVVEGQRLMQGASDIFLGWDRFLGEDGVTRDFYIRQLWDWKASALVEQMTPDVLGIYGQACGWTLARAHARSGDAIAMSAYLGSSDRFDKALSRFASSYADQNERDFAALTQAMASGQVHAVNEV